MESPVMEGMKAKAPAVNTSYPSLKGTSHESSRSGGSHRWGFFHYSECKTLLSRVLGGSASCSFTYRCAFPVFPVKIRLSQVVLTAHGIFNALQCSPVSVNRDKYRVLVMSPAPEFFDISVSRAQSKQVLRKGITKQKRRKRHFTVFPLSAVTRAPENRKELGQI